MLTGTLLALVFISQVVKSDPVARTEPPPYQAEAGEVVVLRNRIDAKFENKSIEEFLNELPVAVVTDPEVLRRKPQSGKTLDEIKALEAQGIWHVIPTGTPARVLIPRDGIGKPEDQLVQVEVTAGPKRGIKGWIEVSRVYPQQISDEGYEPERGDEAVLYSEGVYEDGEQAGLPVRVPVLAGHFAFEECEKVIFSKDTEGYHELVDKKQLVHVDSGTKIRVLKFHKGRDNDEDFVRDAWEVRILGGRYRNNVVWVLADYVTRLKSVEKARPKSAEDIAGEKAARDAEEATAKARAEAEAQAAKARSKAEARTRQQAELKAVKNKLEQKLRLGQALEQRNPKAAIDYYRQAIDLSPESFEAKKAKQRIKVLEKR